MLMWMSEHTIQMDALDKIILGVKCECIREKVCIEPIVEKIVGSRGRWFGLV